MPTLVWIIQIIICRAPKAHLTLPRTFSRSSLVVPTVFTSLDNRRILVCVQLPNETVRRAEVGTTGAPRTFVSIIFKPPSRVAEQQDLNSPLRMSPHRTSYIYPLTYIQDIWHANFRGSFQEGCEQTNLRRSPEAWPSSFIWFTTRTTGCRCNLHRRRIRPQYHNETRPLRPLHPRAYGP